MSEAHIRKPTTLKLIRKARSEGMFVSNFPRRSVSQSVSQPVRFIIVRLEKVREVKEFRHACVWNNEASVVWSIRRCFFFITRRFTSSALGVPEISSGWLAPIPEGSFKGRRKTSGVRICIVITPNAKGSSLNFVFEFLRDRMEGGVLKVYVDGFAYGATRQA